MPWYAYLPSFVSANALPNLSIYFPPLFSLGKKITPRKLSRIFFCLFLRFSGGVMRLSSFLCFSARVDPVQFSLVRRFTIAPVVGRAPSHVGSRHPGGRIGRGVSQPTPPATLHPLLLRLDSLRSKIMTSLTSITSIL